MPKIAEKSNTISQVNALKKGLFLNITSIILLYVLIIGFGKFFLNLLFGNRYLVSYDILLILSLGYMFGMIVHTFSAFWSGINRPEYTTIALMVASLFNIIFCYLLLGYFGRYAIPWAYSVSMIIAAGIDIGLLLKFRNKNPKKINR